MSFHGSSQFSHWQVFGIDFQKSTLKVDITLDITKINHGFESTKFKIEWILIKEGTKV